MLLATSVQRGADTRRVPYWLRVTHRRLGPPSGSLSHTGTYQGDTRGKPARVSLYRYPDGPTGSGVRNDLPGPEEVFSVRLTRRVANFGVVVLSQGRGVRVTPRVVTGRDENRLTGNTGLPVDSNPYLTGFGRLEPIAGAVLPARGLYSVVFDTPSAAAAGRFSFRFWVNDTTPPTARLLTRSVRRGEKLLVVVADSGSGVDPVTISAVVDRDHAVTSYEAGRVSVTLGSVLRRGSHALRLQVSDYQEQKNMEDVGPILPNTRFLRATFVLR